MEERGGANTLWLALERRALGQLLLFEVLDAREVAVDERRIGERPQVFGWLKLGRTERREEQEDMFAYT
jgi:hypothetical protein